jgi:hypothetical protein
MSTSTVLLFLLLGVLSPSLCPQFQQYILKCTIFLDNLYLLMMHPILLTRLVFHLLYPHLLEVLYVFLESSAKTASFLRERLLSSYCWKYELNEVHSLTAFPSEHFQWFISGHMVPYSFTFYFLDHRENKHFSIFYWACVFLDPPLGFVFSVFLVLM